MSGSYDFLSPGINHIRKSIKGIKDSYNNEWDILAELLQNSVDAIRKADNTENKIDIIIDSQQHRITVTDNGVGIKFDQLPVLLKPFSTDKEGDNSVVGEKGVGLSFVIFSSNWFELTTNYQGKSAKATIEDAYNWQNSNSNEILELKINEAYHEAGTSITLEKVIDSPIFDLSFDQLKFILRTKTIIGNTRSIWNDDINIEINLKFTDQNGEVQHEEVPFRYLLLPENVDKRSAINLKDFIKNFSEAGKTDQEKRKALFGKVIYDKGEITHNDNRVIYYYSYFLPKRSMWNEFSKEWGLIKEEKTEDENYLSNFSYALIKPGIFTSVKGMPTGIGITPPDTGYAGYWSNIFIIFEDPQLKFDIGRKSIHGRQAGVLNKHAKDIFNQYLKFITRYVSRDSGVNSNDWDRDEVFGQIEDMLTYNHKHSLFQKSPKGQEAQVCAMFYELVGKGVIKDLVFLTSGYKGRYDLYAKWGNKKVVIEFKSELRNILKDFNTEQKLFDEIDCVVCWDVTEEDERALHKKSISIEDVDGFSILGGNKSFPHATHELQLGGITNPVYIIDLKKVLKDIDS